MANLKAALMSSARTFYMLKEWDKAVREFEKISSEFGEDGMLQEQISICYGNLGNKEKQKTYLTKAIGLTIRPEKLKILQEKLVSIK